MNTSTSVEWEGAFQEARSSHVAFVQKYLNIILIAEWLLCVITAFFVSPKTWQGFDATTHIHIYTAVFGGALAALFPIFIGKLRPGSKQVRYATAISLMLFVTIFTMICGGTQESHFIFFFNMAVLALYEDMATIAIAIGVVVVDHLLRTLLVPFSIWGNDPAIWSFFIIHGAWGTAMGAILMLYINFSLNSREQAIIKDLEGTAAQKHIAEQQAEMAEYMSRNVNKAMREMEHLASGNLTIYLEKEGNDDIGNLFESINRTVESIRELVLQVREAVEVSAHEASELNLSASQIAATAEEQSVQTNEIAAAIGEMSQTINENSRNATQASETATRNGEDATAGADIMAETLKKMNEIGSIVSAAALTVQRLGESSAAIGKIVSVIDEIADQTNLLALNAAIEAARAGDAGRGFAVVADEVRKLAERTGTATKEIANTISGIQEETKTAVESMRRGSEEVKEGLDLADKAGNALEQIVTGAVEIQDMVRQIAAANEQQASASNQIAHTIDSMTHAANDSAQTVSAITVSMEKLADQMNIILELVRQFSVDNKNLGKVAAPSSSKALTKNVRKLIR